MGEAMRGAYRTYLVPGNRDAALVAGTLNTSTSDLLLSSSGVSISCVSLCSRRSAERKGGQGGKAGQAYLLRNGTLTLRCGGHVWVLLRL
jgi:hypothetical protein